MKYGISTSKIEFAEGFVEDGQGVISLGCLLRQPGAGKSSAHQRRSKHGSRE